MQRVLLADVQEALRALWEARSDFSSATEAQAFMDGALGQPAHTGFRVRDVESHCTPNSQRDAYDRGRMQQK